MSYGPAPKSGALHGSDPQFLSQGIGGRRGVNLFTDGDKAVDGEYRRNAYSPADFEDIFGCGEDC